MPRSKTKSCPKTFSGSSKKTENVPKNNKENELKVKAEELLDGIEASLNNSFPDLSKFKYDKKPHIKIEFDKNSSVKDVR